MAYIGETIELMCSDDYKDRMLAEYQQLVIRKDALEKLLTKWEKGELNFTPKCPKEMFVKQFELMEEYAEILRERGVIEGVDLYVGE